MFGTVLLGPLAHLHFNFIEWLIVKRVRPTLVFILIVWKALLELLFSFTNVKWIA